VGVQPNYGDYTTEGLAARLQTFADQNIFFTIVGEQGQQSGLAAAL